MVERQWEQMLSTVPFAALFTLTHSHPMYQVIRQPLPAIDGVHTRCLALARGKRLVGNQTLPTTLHDPKILSTLATTAIPTLADSVVKHCNRK